MLKKAHKGTYHKMRTKQLGRFAEGFFGRHKIRGLDLTDQLKQVVAGKNGTRLKHDELMSGAEGRQNRRRTCCAMKQSRKTTDKVLG